MSILSERLKERRREDREDMIRSVAMTLVVAAFVVMVAALGVFVTGCTPVLKQDVKTVVSKVLTADDEACIVEHALDVQEVNPTVAAIVAIQCGVVPELLADVLKLMGAARVGVIRFADKVEKREEEKKAAEKRGME